MDIKEMSNEELLARAEEIRAEADTLEDLETVEARSAELDSINAELEARKELAAKKAELRNAVVAGAGEVPNLLKLLRRKEQ